MKFIKTIAVFVLFFLSSFGVKAQGYSSDLVELTNFLTRMYKAAPFEGVRVVEDYENEYLLVVLSLDPRKYGNESTMNRVASVKAMSEANRFFNGSHITSDLIIYTTEKSNGESDVSVIEKISERAAGYVRSLQQLTNFAGEDDRRVFLFFKKMD